MKKLKLNLDELRVDSFSSGPGSGNGTVVGLSETRYPATGCAPISCIGQTCGNGPGYCNPYSGVPDLC